MIRPRYAVSPICAAIMPNVRAPTPESPPWSRSPSIASASSTITTTGPIERSTPSTRSRLPFGLADVLAAEVLEHDRRDADRAGDAGREEALAGADRAAEQVAHRHGLELAALDQVGVVEQALLRGLVADHGVEAPLGLDELEHALRLALDQPLLELAEVGPVEAATALDRALHEHLEIGEADAGGELAELRRPSSRRTPTTSLPVALTCAARNVGALGDVGQRHLERRDVRVVRQPLRDARQPRIDQHERHVEPLDVRARRPVEQRHQVGLLVEIEAVAARRDVAGVIDDHRACAAACRDPPSRSSARADRSRRGPWSDRGAGRADRRATCSRSRPCPAGACRWSPRRSAARARGRSGSRGPSARTAARRGSPRGRPSDRRCRPRAPRRTCCRG